MALIISPDGVLTGRGASDGEELIPVEAYAGNKRIVKLVLQHAVTIDSQAFVRCSALKEACLERTEIVGRSAFAVCKELERVRMPKVRVLENGAFEADVKLKEVQVGENLVMVRVGAFNRCASLAELTLMTAAPVRIMRWRKTLPRKILDGVGLITVPSAHISRYMEMKREEWDAEKVRFRVIDGSRGVTIVV